MPELSIIAPTMNEPDAPKTILELVRSFGKSAEIIVIDKGCGSMKGAKQYFPGISA